MRTCYFTIDEPDNQTHNESQNVRLTNSAPSFTTYTGNTAPTILFSSPFGMGYNNLIDNYSMLNNSSNNNNNNNNQVCSAGNTENWGNYSNSNEINYM